MAWRESDVEGTRTDVTNRRPWFANPNPRAHIEHIFGAVGRAGEVGLKESRFLTECGILSETHGIGANSA